MDNKTKINILEAKVIQIERSKYEQEINLEMYEAYGEQDKVKDATRNGIEKQAKSLEVLYKHLNTLGGLKE